MKKLILAVACAALSFGAAAQVSGAAQQQQATSTNDVSSVANGSANNNGSNVAVEFNSPGDTTAHITQDGTITTNNVRSGTATERVEYSGSYKLKNTPSVNGGNLTTSNDTCMGSTSGSVNVPGVGVGFGTTWTDDHCKRLKMSRELWNKGMKAASLAMDCMSADAREALRLTGTKCPQDMNEDERMRAFPVASNFEQAPVAAARPAAPAPVAQAPVAPAPVAIATPVAQTQVVASGGAVVTRDSKGNEFVDLRTPR